MTRTFSAAATVLLLQTVAATQSPPATFQHTVDYGGSSYLVDFESHSARGPNFSIEVQQADGSFVSHTPEPVRTYIGTIPSLPGAMASALRRADGSIYYHVLFDDGAEWIKNGGTTTLRTDADWTPNYPSLITRPGGGGSDVWAAEIGVDLPHSQFAVDGDVLAAVEMIEHSVNTVNLIYLRDACIINRLGRVVIRADLGRDPYAGMTSTGPLLTEIANQWNNVLPPSTHDVALVATSATGGGLASVGVIGNPGYSSNGSTSEGDFTIVWRHEVGHNWSMSHFDGGTPEGATINSGNALSKMSGSEQAKAIAHRDARAASLDNLGPYPTPIPPRASLDRATYPPQGAPFTIDVLANDHDANGDAIQIVGFSSESSLGGSVSLSSGTGPGGRDELLFTPSVVASAEPDLFEYRIADSTGRESLGYVIARLDSDDELLLHLTMDEGSGSAAKDSSSHANHADLTNAPSWTTGAFDGAIEFDGVDDRLITPVLDEPTDRMTISGWVLRSGDQADWAGIAFCRGGTTAAGLNFGTANELRYHWDSGDWTWNSGLVVPDGVWTFVALVVTPSNATVYMDSGGGMQVSTHTTPHSVVAFDSSLRIGHDPHSSARVFRGTLDDVRVYQRDLDAIEILSLAGGPDRAANPAPGHLTTHVASSLTLSWTPTPDAADHRIYFSPVYADVRDANASADRGLNPASSWPTPGLGLGSYFWRVDTFDGSAWTPGAVWSFTIVPSYTTWQVPPGASLQSHIDAAAAGDILVLRGDTYASFSVDKSLTIVGQPNAGTTIEHGLLVIDPPSGSRLRFVDLAFVATETFPPHQHVTGSVWVKRGRVVFENCEFVGSFASGPDPQNPISPGGALSISAGKIILDHCSITGLHSSFGLVVENTFPRVSLVSSTVRGADPEPVPFTIPIEYYDGRSAIDVRDGARVQITDSVIDGGSASPDAGPAGHAAIHADGTVWITDSIVTGGAGGSFTSGAALSGSVFHHARNALAAGTGSPPAPAIDGTATLEPSLVGVRDSTRLDLGSTYALTLTCDAGVPVAILFSTDIHGFIEFPGLLAQPLWNDGGFLTQVVGGVTDGNGEFTLSFELPSEIPLRHQTFCFYAIRGLSLPIQLAPPCGGTLR